MSKGTVEREMDDFTAILDYEYQPPRHGSPWESAQSQGSVTVECLTLVFDGADGPVEIDATTQAERLPFIDDLRDLALAEHHCSEAA